MHNQAGSLDAIRLDIVRVDTVVTDVRIGEGDDLTLVGWIREDLLVAAHGGIEDQLPAALRIEPTQVVWCGQSRFDLLLRLDSAHTIRTLQPDLPALARLPVRGVIVTALGDAADHDFISRFFAPASGVPEDPVTGSAHCALAPFWQPQFGRNTLFGFQASSRGGHVRMDLQGDRVRLTGQAVTVFRGSLLV